MRQGHRAEHEETDSVRMKGQGQTLTQANTLVHPKKFISAESACTPCEL